MTCKWKVFCKQGETCVAHDGYDILRCTAFKDKEVPTTNEEWLHTLNTEEKAKWLSRNSKFMYGCGRMETTPKVMYEEDWECWLKEKHNDGNGT